MLYIERWITQSCPSNSLAEHESHMKQHKAGTEMKIYNEANSKVIKINTEMRTEYHKRGLRVSTEIKTA